MRKYLALQYHPRQGEKSTTADLFKIHRPYAATASEWYKRYSDILKTHKQGVLELIRSAEYYLANKSYNKTREKEIRKHLGYFKKPLNPQQKN